MLKDVMAYIGAHHPDAAPLIPDDPRWQETAATKAPGYSSVTYSAGGWRVTIGHAMTPELTYEVKAEYADGKIVWVGTIKDGTITEESYSSR